MKNLTKLTLAAGVVALLAACGGGGGGGVSVNSDPQGFWVGPASTGYTVNAAILENGETWGVYTSGSTIYGGLYGTTTVNGNSISISGTDFNFTNNSSSSGTLTGTVAAKSTMSLSGSGLSIPLTYQATYDTAASTSAASGTWSFIGRTGSFTLIPGSFTVDSSGAFSVVQLTCTLLGTVAPRLGGKNVYNLNIAPSGFCPTVPSSMTGIAYLDTSVTPNKFISLALNPSKNDGVIVVGTKQ